VLGLQESVVHLLPSSHVTGVYTQPVLGLQESVVHLLPSSHEIGVNTQPLPGEQESVVHLLPSSHVTGVYTQPVAELQESVVHLLTSSQTRGATVQSLLLHELTVQKPLAPQSVAVVQGLKMQSESLDVGESEGKLQSWRGGLPNRLKELVNTTVHLTVMSVLQSKGFVPPLTTWQVVGAGGAIAADWKQRLLLVSLQEYQEKDVGNVEPICCVLVHNARSTLPLLPIVSSRIQAENVLPPEMSASSNW